MAAKKAQTEKKAKGLRAGVGDYKGKTLNLRKGQLGKAGQAAASARKIAISRTKYDPETKKVLGPMGKPITGRVDMGGGNIAVYKNGVRVRAQKPSSGSKRIRPGSPPGGSPPSGSPPPPPPPPPGPAAGDRGTNRGPAMQADRKARTRYEERKSAVGSSKSKPASVSQNLWDRMNAGQKAAFIANPAAYLAGRNAGAVIRKRINPNAGTQRKLRTGSTQEYLKTRGK